MFPFAQRFATRGCVLAVLAAAVTLPGAAADVLYTTGFENPPITTGSLAGQDGWSVYGSGNPLVLNSFPFEGTQSVFLDGNSPDQTGPYRSDASTGPEIDISIELAIFTSSTQTQWQLGALGPGLIGFLGGVLIQPDSVPCTPGGADNCSTIDAITNGYTPVGLFPRATAFDSTAWHNFNLLFDLPAQTYSISLDNTVLASGIPFCGDNGPCAGNSLTTYENALFDTLGQPLASGTPNDSAYLDNFVVASVPEPSTLLLLLVGLAGLGFRSRRK